MDATLVNAVWIAITILCGISQGDAVPAPNRGALLGYCLITSDCTFRTPNECCVSFDGLNADVTLGPDLLIYVDGKCEPRGQIGDSCTLPGGPDTLYITRCPCRSGLVCVRTSSDTIGECQPNK